MKFTAAAATLSLVALAEAAGFQTLPECAQGCLAPLVQDKGCALTDDECICNHFADIRAQGGPCVIEKCSGDELSKALTTALSLCKATDDKPSKKPTVKPTMPTVQPSEKPTMPTVMPSDKPTMPTLVPSENPTMPSVLPSEKPTMPTYVPSETRSLWPSPKQSQDQSLWPISPSDMTMIDPTPGPPTKPPVTMTKIEVDCSGNIKTPPIRPPTLTLSTRPINLTVLPTPVVTAGAAGAAAVPIGGLAVLALGALVL